MIGLFRPKRLGKVFSYSNQYIETSFLLFLVPLDSYFINLNANETYKIPLNKVSLKNHCISFSLFASGILFFMLMVAFGPKFSEGDSNAFLGYFPIIISGLLILAGFSYSFSTGKSTRYETKKRTIFQNVVGLNALPEWLSIDTARSIYEKQRINLPADWKDKVQNNQFSTDAFFYYYTMLSYEQKISPNAKNAELLNMLDKRLNK